MCCFECQRRHVGCHATCEDYIAFKSTENPEAKEKKKQSEINSYIRRFRRKLRFPKNE